MEVWEATLVEIRQLQRLKNGIFGLNSKETWHMFRGALIAKKERGKHKILDHTSLYQFQHTHGKTFLWTLSSVFHVLNKECILFLWWWTDSPKWHISFLIRKYQMPFMWTDYVFRKLLYYTRFRNQSLQIKITKSWPISGWFYEKELGQNWILAAQPILSLMDKLRLWTRYSKI